jgi:hypothetical protein
LGINFNFSFLGFISKIKAAKRFALSKIGGNTKASGSQVSVSSQQSEVSSLSSYSRSRKAPGSSLTSRRTSADNDSDDSSFEEEDSSESESEESEEHYGPGIKI